MKLYTNPSQLNQPPGYGRIGAHKTIVTPTERRTQEAARAHAEVQFARYAAVDKRGGKAVVRT